MEAPPPPPEITVEQAADLRCLGLGLFLAESTGGREPRLVHIYLKRLQKADPSRDWKAHAPKFSSDMLYGEFMGQMNECQDRQEGGERPPTRRPD